MKFRTLAIPTRNKIACHRSVLLLGSVRAMSLSVTLTGASIRGTLSNLLHLKSASHVGCYQKLLFPGLLLTNTVLAQLHTLNSPVFGRIRLVSRKLPVIYEKFNFAFTMIKPFCTSNPIRSAVIAL